MDIGCMYGRLFDNNILGKLCKIVMLKQNFWTD